MIKVKGINVGFDGVRTECEIFVDTSGEFNISAKFEKSNSRLEEADSIVVDAFDSYGYQSEYWERGTLQIEVIKEVDDGIR